MTAMNKDREPLVELALNECARLFGGQRKAAASSDGRLGRFPQQAVIRYREPGVKGEVISAWLLNGDAAPAEAPTALQPSTERDGMYYTDGLFCFSISESGTTVWIDMILGPRFGRGFEYTVSSPYGKPKLDGQKVLWVS